jgi:hypothetical protein
MPLLGYVLAFENEPLGLSLFGAPKEILDALRSRRMDYAPFVDHPQTTIDAADVHKTSPHITFGGGPHAEATLELIEAVRAADSAAVSAVLERDPDVVRPGHSGAGAPLLVAASAGQAQIVRALLEAGAGVDDDGEFEMTPLQWAAALGSEETVNLLLDAGADAARKSWFYVAAGELAMMNDHPAVARRIAARSGLPSRSVTAEQVLERMRHAASTDRSG